VTSELLTTREAASVLSLSAATLHTWRCKRGRIARDGLNGPQFLRIGRTIRYRRADLDAWMALHPILSRNG
jgi:predicted DNA-binding transcriptional regulator AlpA